MGLYESVQLKKKKLHQTWLYNVIKPYNKYVVRPHHII